LFIQFFNQSSYLELLYQIRREPYKTIKVISFDALAVVQPTVSKHWIFHEHKILIT